MSLHANKNEIEWMDVGCATENWVLCQRLQSLSLEELQRSVLRANKELQELHRVTSQLTFDLNEANKKVDVLLTNPSNALSHHLIDQIQKNIFLFQFQLVLYTLSYRVNVIHTTCGDSQ